MKKIISVLLALAIAICALPMSVFAIDGDNSGTGADGGYTSVSGSTWNTPQQGYRFCICDKKGVPVTNAVDILFTAFPTNSERMYSSRTGGTVGAAVLWSDVGVTPPYAVAWNGGPVGNGETFKNWFTSGSNAKSILTYAKNGIYVFAFNNAADRALVSGGKTPYEVCSDKDYYITIEPITWFVPAAWNSAAGKVSATNYGKYIYGTIYNICGWYKNTSGSSKYGSGGGAYSNVLNVMWQSMYTIGGLGTSVSGVNASDVISYADTTNNLATIYSKLSGGFGAALHVYYLGATEMGGTATSEEGQRPGTGDPAGNIGTGSFSYPVSTTVITSVTLVNTGTSDEQDIGTANPATVTFSVNNQTYTVNNVYVPHGSSQKVWIEWKTPSVAKTLTMTVSTNRGSFSSASGTSSSLALTITVFDYGGEKTPPDPIADDKATMFGYTTSASESYLRSLSTVTSSTSWYVWNCKYLYTRTVIGADMPDMTVSYTNLATTLEDLKKKGYVIKSYTEKQAYQNVHWIHHCADGENIVQYCKQLSDSGATEVVYHSNNNTITYTRYQIYGTGNYTVKYKNADYGVLVYQYDKITYTAEIKSPVIKINPGDTCPTWFKRGSDYCMKSGYGIYVSAKANISLTISNAATGTTTTTTIATGSTSNSAAVGFQWAYAYFPEFTYQTYNRLLELENDRTFGFRWNEYSAINGGDDVHYTPIWYPDNTDYVLYVRMNFAYTPNGALSVGGTSNRIIIDGNVYDDWHVTVVR